MLLNQSNLLEYIKQECSEDTQEIILCSAFLKKNILIELEPFLNNCDDVKIYVRWQEIDLAMKVSDLDIYEICKEHNWQLYYNRSIHAKFFMINDESLILGSSNYTLSGTGRAHKNIEWNKLTSINELEANELKSSISLSTLVDDVIYETLKTRVKEMDYVIEEIGKLDTIEPKEIYNFHFDRLPSFSPRQLFNPPLSYKTEEYLKRMGVDNTQNLDILETFILNNPITKIIRRYHSTEGDIARWGSICSKIEEDEYLFELCDYDTGLLEEALYTDNRLYHLFCWLEEFDNTLKLHVNERYLDDPRRGTCSINLI